MMRGVFFDAGNTILFPDYEIYRDICTALGVDVEIGQVIDAEAKARAAFDSAVRSAPNAKVHGFWPVFYTPFYERLGLPPGSVSDAIEMTQVANDTGLGIWKEPAEGLDELLDELAIMGMGAGVISNSDGRLEERMAEIGILERFDFVIDSAVVGVSKPNSRIFEMALERSGLEASDTAYVGDYYEVDVVGSRSVGMRPILLDPAGVYGEADCEVVSSLTDVIELLRAEGDHEVSSEGSL